MAGPDPTRPRPAAACCPVGTPHLQSTAQRPRTRTAQREEAARRITYTGHGLTGGLPVASPRIPPLPGPKLAPVSQIAAGFRGSPRGPPPPCVVIASNAQELRENSTPFPPTTTRRIITIHSLCFLRQPNRFALTPPSIRDQTRGPLRSTNTSHATPREAVRSPPPAPRLHTLVGCLAGDVDAVHLARRGGRVRAVLVPGCRGGGGPVLLPRPVPPPEHAAARHLASGARGVQRRLPHAPSPAGRNSAPLLLITFSTAPFCVNSTARLLMR